MKRFREYSGVFALSLVVMIMAGIKAWYKYKPEETPAAAITVTPTTIPTAEPTKMTDKDYPLWWQLPYSGIGFTIEKYSEPLTLEIKAVGLGEKIVRERVEKWLEENQVASDSHKLKIN